jgi:hypothetical protein
MFRSHPSEPLDPGRGRVARQPVELCPDGGELLRHDGPAVCGDDQPVEHHGPAPELGQPFAGL